MKKKSVFGIVFLLVAIALLAVCYYINNMSYVIYSGVLVFIAFIVFVITIIPSKNEETIYKNELARILKTYNAVLSKIKEFPELKHRNVLSLDKIDDLVNAQSEIRKPIYYMEEMDSCIFFIIDEDNMIYFVLRKNSSSANQIDEWAKLQKQKVKDNVISDSNLLDEIDKTTIVKLNNKKSFKVSPIRKKDGLKVDDTIQASSSDNKEKEDTSKVDENKDKSSEILTTKKESIFKKNKKLLDDSNDEVL